MNWINNPSPTLVEYLRRIPQKASLQDVFIHTGVASQRYRPYQFVLEKEGLTHAEFSQKFKKGTIAKYLEKNNLLDNCIDWLQRYFPKDKFSMEGSSSRTHIDSLRHIQKKLSMNKGYWDDSIKFMGDSFTAVIKKNIVSAIHPEEDRFFNLREILHIMGFPADYEISSVKQMNHMCQTVPVNTAKDWTEEVVKFCRGELRLSDAVFVKQDNTAQTIIANIRPSSTEQRKKRKVSANNLGNA